MGRIRQTGIKRIAEELFTQDSSRFGAEFVKNKNSLKALKIISSKRTVNRVAGYIVKVAKNKAF
ncbi:MAG: 30S ribosomal protein S17e [DPANN group archaeon]|nr:30S ribosomal protein S17e [DPANN group archaeon]